jgi:hypothetical protein
LASPAIGGRFLRLLVRAVAIGGHFSKQMNSELDFQIKQLTRLQTSLKFDP